MTQAAINNAKVLFQLEISPKEVEQAAKVFASSNELQCILKNPVIPEKTKEDILKKLFKKDVYSEKMCNYLRIMSRFGNMGEIQDIFQAYYRYWDEQHHILRGELISAEEPSEKLIASATERLQETYPEYEIILTKRVDASLIGGYMIRVDHREFDQSYEGRLHQLERKLMRR